MRRKLWIGLATGGAVLGLVIVVLVLAGGSDEGKEHGEREGGARIEVRDPDKGGKPGRNPTAEAYENRAYPRGYIRAEDVKRARAAYQGLPRRLGAGAFRKSNKATATIRAAVGAPWTFIGPAVGAAPGPVTESLKDSIASGRITALAIDPNCGSPGQGCRLWLAAAGGGIWRTANALADPPTWTALETGLPTNAFGSLVEDPNDASGNTLYAGTGEANAINQAGLGLYKTTDGGDHWSLVAGSFAVTKDRSIGAIRIAPGSPGTIWIGTSLGRQGQSSVNGGGAEPPAAPTIGIYRSTNGGSSFQLQFSQPSGGALLNTGGVTDIELDPAHPDRVYAALFGKGVWRTAAADEGGDAGWKQVFVPANPGTRFDRTEIALTTAAGHTRIYLGNGGLDADFNPTGDFYRVDDADVSAATLAGAGGDNAGWTQLSSATNGSPGFASYQWCQGQCNYDVFVEVDPSNPDVVWFGGSMVYEEIRPLQDQSLIGVAPNRSNGRAVMRSQDAGVHFTDMTADNQGPPREPPADPTQSHYEQMHPDQHALVFDPQNSNIAFVGSDGGLVRTDGTFDDVSSQCPTRDGLSPADTPDAADLADCAQWLSKVPHRIVNMNAGLATLQFVSLSVDPRNPLGNLLGGTQDNGTFAYDVLPGQSTRSWFESVNGDGAASGFDVGDPAVRYHTYFLGLGDINHHGADPNTWSFITQPILDSFENVSFYTPVTLDPKVPGTIYLGAQHVWRTKDNGGDAAELEAHCISPGGVPEYDGSMECGDFEALGADLTTSSGSRAGQYIAAVERAPSDVSTLWVATRLGRVFVSKNATDEATNVAFDRIDTAATPGRFVSGIAVDPANPNHAWVSYSGYNAATPATPGHVFDVRYDTAAHHATFTDISHDLADQPITDVVFDGGTGDLYAATDYGVVRLPAGASAWEQAASGFPPASTPGLTIHPAGRVLYAATYGRSAYRLALAPAARISGPAVLRVGQTGVYDGRASSAFGGADLTYRWTLPSGRTATGSIVAYQATGAPGPRTLRLTVTAPDGRAGTTTKTITVTKGGGTAAGGGPVTLVGGRQLRVSRRGVLRVRLACPASQPLGCAGKLSLEVRLSHRRRRLATNVSFAVPKGSQATVILRISRGRLRALGGRHRLAGRLRVVQLQPSGSPRVFRLPVVLVLRR